MSESLIRENLYQLEKNISTYKQETILNKKVLLAGTIFETISSFTSIISKMNELEKNQLVQLLPEAEGIVQEAYGSDVEKMEVFTELKRQTTTKKAVDFDKDLELQVRLNELTTELKSLIRTEGSSSIKRDIFDAMNHIEHITLYNEAQKDAKKKNANMSLQEYEKLEYLKEKLRKIANEYAEELYFKNDLAFKVIADSWEKRILNSDLLELNQALETIDSIREDTFATITMNQQELNLLKNKLKKITTQQITKELSQLPENVKRILDIFKNTMERETYSELISHSRIVEQLKIESFSKERLTTPELNQLKGALKYLFAQKIQEQVDNRNKEEKNKYINNPAKKAKLENFKTQWLNAHATMNEADKKEHLKMLNYLKENSISGITLTADELDFLKNELIQKGIQGMQLSDTETKNMPSAPNSPISGNAGGQQTSAPTQTPTQNPTSSPNPNPDPIDRPAAIENYKRDLVEKIQQLPEAEREQAFNELEIKKDSIPGIELTDEEINQIKESVKSQTIKSESDDRSDKIANFINDIVNKIQQLPEAEREKAFNELEIKKDSIPGIELTDEEINQIKETIKSKVLLKEEELDKIKEQMENLVYIQTLAIQKMDILKIEEELKRVTNLNYNEFQEIKLTEKEFEIYKKLWIRELETGRTNELIDAFWEAKGLTGQTIDELQKIEFTEEELKANGFDEKNLNEAKEKLNKRIQKLIQDYQGNVLRSNSILPINEKIVILEVNKLGFRPTGKVKGYIFTNGSDNKKFETQEAAQKFVKEHPEYELKSYVIKKQRKEVEISAYQIQSAKNNFKKPKKRFKILNIKVAKTNKTGKLNVALHSLTQKLNARKKENEAYTNELAAYFEEEIIYDNEKAKISELILTKGKRTATVKNKAGLAKYIKKGYDVTEVGFMIKDEKVIIDIDEADELLNEQDKEREQQENMAKYMEYAEYFDQIAVDKKTAQEFKIEKIIFTGGEYAQLEANSKQEYARLLKEVQKNGCVPTSVIGKTADGQEIIVNLKEITLKDLEENLNETRGR